MDSPDLKPSEPKSSSTNPTPSTITLSRDEQGRFVNPKAEESKPSIVRDDFDILPLKKYFEIDTADPVEDSRLQSIYDELRQLGISTAGDAMAKLKELEMRLGRDHMENRPAKILTYLRLSKDVGDKIKQMQAMEWGSR